MPIAFGASLGTAIGTSPDNSWDITTTAAVPAGGTIVVGIGFFNASSTASASGGGLTWTTQATQAVSSRNVVIATASAPAGLASGSTITVNVPAGSFACGAGAMYLTGADTLDASGVGSSSATATWTASLTTVAADTMVIGFGWQDNVTGGSSTPGSGYTEWCDFVNATDSNEFSGVYQIVTSNGAYTPGGNFGGILPWVAVGVSLKAGAGGGAAGADTYPTLRPGFMTGPAFPAFMRALSAPGIQEAVSSLTKVTSTRSTTWNAKAQVTSTRATTWRVNGPEWFTAIGGTTPELIVSSEDWSLLTNANVNHAGNTHQTFVDYFSARQAQGFNAVEVTMFSYPDPSHITQNGEDSDGVWPFASSSNNPSNAFNSTWTARRDDFFAVAATYGFRVFMNITTPYLDLGAFTASWTNTQWTNWGTKIGTQWGSVTNVMWMFGDDYFGDLDTNLTACLTAMRAAGANQPVSIQNHQEMTSRKTLDSPFTALSWGQTNAQFNWVYTYNPTYDGVEKAGLENATLDPIPYLWADGFFLNSSTTGITDKNLMRRMVWWALSSGSKGVNIGNNTVYPWDTTAAYTEATTNTFYTSQVPAIAGYFKNLPKWHLLKADTSSTLVTAGRGTHATPRTSGGSGGQTLDNSDSYVTASYIQSGADAGKLAVIYMSHASTITIDQTKMVAGYTATWVDPASGATSSATPGSSYNSGSKGSNSVGDADWVLVLRENTLTQVTSTRATTWDTLAQVSSTRATTYDVLARVTASRATTWDVLTQTTATRATTFRVLANVTTTRATTWRVLARVTSSRATTWDVLGAVTATRATTWRVLAQVTGTRATTWNVASGLVSVTSTRSTTWRVLANVTASRATTYDVLAQVTATRATTYDVLTRVTASRSTTYDVLAQVTASRATTWNVASGLVSVTSSRSTTWRVLARTTATRDASWDTLARATGTRTTTWDVTTLASSARATSWRTLRQILSSRATTWNVAALAPTDDTNPIDITIRDQYHSTTVGVLGSSATIRAFTHATATEN